MYTFDQVAGESAQFEAHSDAQVFYWLFFPFIFFVFNEEKGSFRSNMKMVR